jgi:predicted transcriptional regulator
VVITVRLDKATEKKLDRLVRMTGRTKSEIVREAIARLETGPAESVHDGFSDVIGMSAIGGDRARRSEEILREAFSRGRGKRKSQP